MERTLLRWRDTQRRTLHGGEQSAAAAAGREEARRDNFQEASCAAGGGDVGAARARRLEQVRGWSWGEDTRTRGHGHEDNLSVTVAGAIISSMVMASWP